MSLHQKVEALLPVPQSYSYRSADDAPKYRLPFVKGEELRPISFWDVPNTDCYETACIVGQEYAGHYLQYLKEQHSSHDNTLGSIVQGMASGSGNRGFAVGFFTYLEGILSEWAKEQSVYDRLVQDRESHIREVLELEEMEQEEAEQQLQEKGQHESK